MQVLFLISIPFLIGTLAYRDICNQEIFSSISNNSQEVINETINNSSLFKLDYSTFPLPLISQDNTFWLLHINESLIINLKNIFGSRLIITGIAINQIPPQTEFLRDKCVTNVDYEDTQEFLIRNTIDGVSSNLVSGYSSDGLYVFNGVARDLDVSVKRAVNPTLSDAIEITKVYNNNNNNNNNLPYCLRIELYGCIKKTIISPLMYPTILFYDFPNSFEGIVTDLKFRADYQYTGICSGLYCTGGNGLLTNGDIGVPTSQNSISLYNCSKCKLTFYFSSLANISSIRLYGVFGMYDTVVSYPPFSIGIQNEITITYDPNNGIDLHTQIGNNAYSIEIQRPIYLVGELTLELTAYVSTTLLVNEIQLRDGDVILNTQTQELEFGYSTREKTQPTSQTTNDPLPPTLPPNTQPTLPPNTQPTPPPNTQPTLPPNTQPTLPPNTQPTLPPNTQPTPPPNTQPTPPPNTQPTPPPNTQPTPPPPNPNPDPNPNPPPPPNPNPDTTNPNQGSNVFTDPTSPQTDFPNNSLTNELFNLSYPSTIISLAICILCILVTCVSLSIVTVCWFFLTKYKLKYDEVKKEVIKFRITQEVLAKNANFNNCQLSEFSKEKTFNRNWSRNEFMSPPTFQTQFKPPLPPDNWIPDSEIYEAIPAQIFQQEMNSYIRPNCDNNHFIGNTMGTIPLSTSSHNLVPMKEEGYMAMSPSI